MRNVWQAKLMVVLMLLWAMCGTVHAAKENKQMKAKSEKLLAELKTCKYKIICETYRDNNWELMIMNADGSNPVNITQSPVIDELYPHASPDGTKVVFLAEEGKKDNRTRNVYYMNLDGTERTKVGENGRQPFWNLDGKVIAFAKGAGKKDLEQAEANQGLYFYNIETRKITRHRREDIAGLINPCWSSNGKWIISTVNGGMGIFWSICAIAMDGNELVELTDGPVRCRPDLTPDDKHIAWCTELSGHMWVEVGDIDLDSPRPEVTNRHYVVTVDHPHQTYHVDWSPDGRYIAYSQGALESRMRPAPFVIGRQAKGWNLWVVKPSEPEVVVQITHDGLSYKEPDWVLVKEKVSGVEKPYEEKK